MRQKIFLLIALLCAAAQGAWAQNNWEEVYTLTQTTSANWTALSAGSTTGQVLGTAGNTTYYYANSNLSFTNSNAGGSGLTIRGSVYLYVPQGVTVTCTGANASGQTGAGAGIELTPGNTLLILGGGTVNATGGNAANGGNGGNGGNASGVWNEWTSTGAGGNGGYGGGGAGAGIGTRGGNGGSGGSGGSGYTYTDWKAHNGTNGTAGSAGATAGDMGNLYMVMSFVNLSATGGAAGTSGGNGGNRGRGRIDDEGNNYSVSGGGGGGAGGFGGAASNIGTGGPGGGGGGSGAGGAQDWKSSGYYDVTAYGGKGGQNADGGYAADGAEALTSRIAMENGWVDTNGEWDTNDANSPSGAATFGNGGAGGACGNASTSTNGTNISIVTSETTTMTSGTYTVLTDVTVSERIQINGNVTLNLGEGATLHAPKGIEVSNNNSANLTINGPGALTIDGCEGDKSGIGAFSVGTLTINGGTINVNGGTSAAGIGGDLYNTNGGSITINGGVVNAWGGSRGAGIGGGEGRSDGWYGGECGTININGGQVSAYGGLWAPGIGPGFVWGTSYNSGTLNLRWTNHEDFVYSTGYVTDQDPPITLHQINFVNSFILDGTATIATRDNIGGQKIVSYVSGQTALSGSGTEEAPWLIYTTADWNALVQNVLNENSYSGEYVKLMADIDITRGVGANDTRPFSGTFLGNNHTITANLNGLNEGTAPFICISGATIRDLTVAGNIASNQYYTSGLVGFADGTNLIEGCIVTATLDLHNHYAGGIVGHGKTSTTTIKDCIFAGHFSGNQFTITVHKNGGSSTTGPYLPSHIGGLWGWSDSGTPTLQNCLEKGTYTNIASMHPIGLQGGSGTISQPCYYLTPQIGSPSNACTVGGAYRAYTVNTVEGEMLRPLQLADGNTYYTPCLIVVDDHYHRTGSSVSIEPVVTASDGTPLTLGTDFTATLNGDAVAAFPISIATLGNKTFTITGLGDCHGSKSVNFTIAGFNGEGTEENPYIISSTDEWDAFACEVNNGNACSGKYIKLTADIDITQKCGTVSGSTPEHAFSGTFLGNGHTITATITDNCNQGTAPFRYINGATIRDLTTAGSVSTNQAHSSGLVGFADGTNLIEDCKVTATITINCDYAGGFVGHGLSSVTTIQGCVFAGAFDGISWKTYQSGFTTTHSPKNIGSFWGWSDNAAVTLENCLEMGSYNNVYYIHPMGLQGGSGTLTNCYYKTTPTQNPANAWTVTPNSEYCRIYTDHSDTEICKSITVNNTTVYSAASTVSGVESTYDYTGSAIDVVPSVTNPFGALLTAGTDYTVTFSPYPTVQEAGVYTMTISGVGSYVGTKTIQFKVLGPDDNPVVSNSTTELTTGAYDVAFDVTIESRITITGDVTLNLCEGATLTAPKGIELTSGNSLVINGPGALTIDGCESGKSGIGAFSVGTLTINGGTINVNGGTTAAGIGGDKNNNAGGSITINGGVVNATGGYYYGAGIGGGFDNWNGNYGLCGDITINGGQVTATGGLSAPGIGPGAEIGGSAFYSSGSLTLGWTSPTDFVYNSGLSNNEGSTLESITFADGKAFVLDGTTTLATTDNIGGQKIVPALTLADNASNSTTIETYAGETMAVVLNDRTLYKDGDWNTLCLPFDVTIAGSPLDGATARALTSASIEGTTLTLTFGDAVTTLEAGTPYIIKWTADANYVDDDAHNIVSPVFSGVTIDADADGNYDTETASPAVTTDERVRFLGTYKSTAFDAEDKSILFMGGNNTLYYPQSGAGIGAQRAYFKIGDDGAMLARRLTAFNIDFGDDEATGIIEVHGSGSMVSGSDAWYTLDGRRLSQKPSRAGVYINKGNKVVIK